MFKVRPKKSNLNRTCITIGGNRISYPEDVGTKKPPLEIFKMMINSVLSCRGSKFCTFDISNFYLCIPLNHPKHIRIRLVDIPQ